MLAFSSAKVFSSAPVQLLTDSASDIPKDIAAELGIRVLSFSIAVEGKSYLEREDFSEGSFLELLSRVKEIPKTAAINAAQFLDAYQLCAAEGCKHLVHVTINSGGSLTHSAAQTAMDLFRKQHPNSPMQITLLDSKGYSACYGWPVIKAARKLQKGVSAAEIIRDLQYEMAHTSAILGVFSLDFIRKSGRISAAAAIAGGVLGIRPIIEMYQGQSTVLEKVRGDKNVLPAMVAAMRKNRIPDSEFCLAYTRPEDRDALLLLCKEILGQQLALMYPLGAAVVSNTGPTGIGLVHYRKLP